MKSPEYFAGRRDAYLDAVSHIVEQCKLLGGQPLDFVAGRLLSQVCHDYRIFANAAQRSREEAERREELEQVNLITIPPVAVD